MRDQLTWNHRKRTWGVLALAWVATVACASTPVEPIQPVSQRSAVRTPKKTIAVARFDANGAFLSRYGGTSLGGGLAAQMATELEHSGRFIVVERAELGSVLQEQEMALSGLTGAPTSARAGELIGAQLLVRASVTEFSENDGGSGFSIGGPISGSFGSVLGTRTRRGKVAIDVRVIDTTSGRVVASHRVAREIKRTSLGLQGASRGGTSLGYDSFKGTALGTATREAISEAVAKIGSQLDDVPWNAQVAKVRADQVYVSAGINANLRGGDRLHVFRVVDRVVDPRTLEVLGLDEQRIGTVTLGSVNDRYSVGVYAGNHQPQIGDIVRYERAAAGSQLSSLRINDSEALGSTRGRNHFELERDHMNAPPSGGVEKGRKS
jgi:curli biogenesis system outer membrane secretion channel CsgG